MSNIDAMKVLSTALDKELHKGLNVDAPVQLNYSGEYGGSFNFTITPPAQIANGISPYTTTGTTVISNGGWAGGGWTPGIPNVVPWIGDTPTWRWETGISTYPVPDTPVPPTYIPNQPQLTPEQIIELGEVYKKLLEEGKDKITIDDKKLKKAAKEHIGHEPTQEELDDIRRQIRDRMVTEDREL